MKRGSGRLGSAVREMVRSIDANRITGLAAELTFFAVFSLFPGLLIVAGALGSLDSIFGTEIAIASKSGVVEFLQKILTEKAQNVTDAVRELFETQSGGLLTLAALLALYTLSTCFATLIEALDLIYGVQERRSWLRIRLLALVLAVASIVMLAMLLTVIVVGPLVGSIGHGGQLARLAGLSEFFASIWNGMRPPFAFALLVGWVTTIYHVAPNRRTPWLRELPGGALAAVLMLASSYGFRIYLEMAASANKILGVLGGGLILMMWLYALSLSILVGAVFNTVYWKRESGISS
ncbi:MAG TPA: YihY/virulence factor BrkB family protein [Patescibacteria group bacterium]|nr:YihY/virulence factor BrkB family protein [Patescibacteria group bacterium]